MADCLISFGSNQGDGSAAFARVCDALNAETRFLNVRGSRLYATIPIGTSEPQANYVNAAIRFSTDIEPAELLHGLLELEVRLGRVRHGRWGPRTVDLDLLLYGQQRLRNTIENGQTLIVPHSRMSFRRFVIVPAAEIAADMVHPTARMSIGELLAHLDSRSSVVAILGNPELAKTVAHAIVAKRKTHSGNSATKFSNASSHFAIVPVETMGQWIALPGKPMLAVYWRHDHQVAAAAMVCKIVDDVYAGPRLELESDNASAVAREIEAAIAAMLPGSVL